MDSASTHSRAGSVSTGVDPHAFSAHITDYSDLEFSRKLDDMYIMARHHILQHQNLATGLFPSDVPCHLINKYQGVSHIRDTLYAATSLWSLGQAFRQVNNDKGRSRELSGACMKAMRGVLLCWMRQSERLENFKLRQRAENALHSYFYTSTGDPCFSDDEYGHLQIDTVSLFVLMLVQMIESGIKLIWSSDEVSFVQNLLYYLERSYRSPDYGMWARGSKYNNGSLELHASSIGMAKSALESINGFNLYGKYGAAWSVVYVDVDAHNRNRIIFETMLPSESNSKDVDIALLPALGWPFYASHDSKLHKKVLGRMENTLLGKYGFRRFDRDGLGCVLEEKSKRYYRPAEIKNFDGVESEWPVFVLYMLISAHVWRDKDRIEKYMEILKPLLRKGSHGLEVPRYYYVHECDIDIERRSRGSSDRLSDIDDESVGQPFIWGQSVYLIYHMIECGVLRVNDLDPIRRYLSASERPKKNTRYCTYQGHVKDLVVQVALISESVRLQQMLATYGIETQTPQQIEPIQIWSPHELTKVFAHLGQCDALKLSGRPLRPFGNLSTSMVYRIHNQTVLCYPLEFEISEFYLARDISMVIEDVKNAICFLARRWRLRGRPVFVMLIRETLVKGPSVREFLDLLVDFRRGTCEGVAVRLGRLQTLIASSAMEHLDFLSLSELKGSPFEQLENSTLLQSSSALPSRRASKFGTGLQQRPLELKSDVAALSTLRNMSGADLEKIVTAGDQHLHSAQALQVLSERHGIDHEFDGRSIKQRLESIKAIAGEQRNWRVIRMTTGLLRKSVDSLAPALAAVLVTRRQVALGMFNSDEVNIDAPISPDALVSLMYKLCADQPVQAVLQQEVLQLVGKLIQSDQDLFTGILKVRIGWLIRAMELLLQFEGARLYPHAPTTPTLETLAPSEVKFLLVRALQKPDPEFDTRSILERRRLEGALCRVPAGFYSMIWHILEKTPKGIQVTGFQLPPEPTLSDMTQHELNFALLVEKLLSGIKDTAYRQLIVEAIMVVSTILKRNPEFTFSKVIDMEKLVATAFAEFRKTQRDFVDGEETEDKQKSLTDFYTTSPQAQNGSINCVARAVMDELLQGEVRFDSSNTCSVQ